MKLGEDLCWQLLADCRRAILATLHARRGVDAAPVVFALIPPASASGPQGGRPTIVIPVDNVKPKRTVRLQRLANLERDPRCVLMFDHYDEDWSALWWVRVHARAVPSELTDSLVSLLADRYPQYRRPGSVARALVLQPTEVRGWSASGGDDG